MAYCKNDMPQTLKLINIGIYEVHHSNSSQLIFLGITKCCDLNGVWVWIGSLYYSISNDLPVPPIQVCRVEKWGASSAHTTHRLSLKWVMSKLQVELSQSKSGRGYLSCIAKPSGY